MSDKASSIFQFQNNTKLKSKNINHLVCREVWRTCSHQPWVEGPEAAASSWWISSSQWCSLQQKLGVLLGRVGSRPPSSQMRSGRKRPVGLDVPRTASPEQSHGSVLAWEEGRCEGLPLAFKIPSRVTVEILSSLLMALYSQHWVIIVPWRILFWKLWDSLPILDFFQWPKIY